MISSVATLVRQDTGYQGNPKSFPLVAFLRNVFKGNTRCFAQQRGSMLCLYAFFQTKVQIENEQIVLFNLSGYPYDFVYKKIPVELKRREGLVSC